MSRGYDKMKIATHENNKKKLPDIRVIINRKDLTLLPEKNTNLITSVLHLENL